MLVENQASWVGAARWAERYLIEVNVRVPQAWGLVASAA
jgi:hypothetical protein